MNAFIIFTSAVLGVLVGSFLNVVALRYNTGQSLGGRSGCYSCGHQLSWYELVPLFSWLVQKGRCRNCSSRISSMYFLGELTTMVFFALIAARGIIAGVDVLTLEYLVSTLYFFVIFSLLEVILLYDIRHKIIPDGLSAAFGALAFSGLFFITKVDGFFSASFFLIPTLWHVLAGLIVPLPFVLIWIISKGQWIGLGDPKLMVGMGFLFGISQGFTAVFVSFWIGALFAISLMIINKILNKTLLRTGKKSIMKEELPFAPFLIFGVLVTLVFNIHLFI